MGACCSRTEGSHRRVTLCGGGVSVSGVGGDVDVGSQWGKIRGTKMVYVCVDPDANTCL